jgi:hypothetical protein
MPPGVQRCIPPNVEHHQSDPALVVARAQRKAYARVIDAAYHADSPAGGMAANMYQRARSARIAVV